MRYPHRSPLVTTQRKIFSLTAFAFAFAAVALCSSASAVDTLTNGGAKVMLNFQNPIDSNITFTGEIPVSATNFAGASVGVSFGPLSKNFVLDNNGQAIRTNGFFELRPNGATAIFNMNVQVQDLPKTFAPLGLTNTDANGTDVSISVVVGYGDIGYTATLTGKYYSKANVQGVAYYGTITPPDKPQKPVTHIKTVHAFPNPILPGQTTYLKGTLNLKELTGDIKGQIFWGDGSPALRAPGTEIQSMLKTGIAHTYATPGVFTCRMMVMGANEVIATRVFVIVGLQTVVNSKNGLIAQLQKSGSGLVTLNLTVDGVPGAVDADTVFKDQKGMSAGLDPFVGKPLVQGRDVATGTSPSRIFTQPGIFIAETTALDQDGNPVGMIRKTIAVSAADVGMSMAATSESNPTEAKAAPRDTPDTTITLNSMKGKFIFTSSNLDKVTFTGTIALPAGFQPKNPAGNDLTIAMGNVIDTIHLNEKAKLVLPTATGRITRFKIVAPHLGNGIAVGGETAKVNITLNVADLDVQGFDSEGITVSVRSDEEGMSPVSRFIQVDMLISGQTFSAVVPVEYSISGTDFGSISGRSK